MGGLALLARELGLTVSGCDANVYPPMSDQLAAAGIALHEGYDPEALPDDALIVVGNAMSRGNPAVEAMALGCPVVVSSAGALPEVVGPAGVVAPVGDVGSMTDAVVGILDDPAMAEDLRRRGRRRAKDFGVDIAAERLGQVYREVVDTARI